MAEPKVRLNLLDRFAVGIADINISRNPLRSEVILMFNNVIRDHYQDVVSMEVLRVKKWGLVTKNLDLNYVQQLGDVLIEDTDNLPWVVSVTMTGLPRTPKMDDQVLIDGIKYTISVVKPINRDLRSIVLLLIYPERSSSRDPLAIYNVCVKEGFLGKTYLDILYGGGPKEYSFDREEWFEFQSRIEVMDVPSVLYLRNETEEVVYDIPV